jgi:hypothetical protein
VQVEWWCSVCAFDIESRTRTRTRTTRTRTRTIIIVRRISEDGFAGDACGFAGRKGAQGLLVVP